MVAPQLMSSTYFTPSMLLLKQEADLQEKVDKFPRMEIHKEQRMVHFQNYHQQPCPVLPEGRDEVLLAPNRHEAVQHFVTLEQVLQDLGGAHA